MPIPLDGNSDQPNDKGFANHVNTFAPSKSVMAHESAADDGWYFAQSVLVAQRRTLELPPASFPSSSGGVFFGRGRGSEVVISMLVFFERLRGRSAI